MGTPLHLLGRGLPDGRRPLGLLSLEDPEGRLCQVARHGADGDGMSIASTNLVVDPTDVLGLPGGVVPVAEDDVGGLNESPLEVLVGGFAHVAEAGLAPLACTLGTTPA